jgi:hypothetical protein
MPLHSQPIPREYEYTKTDEKGFHHNVKGTQLLKTCLPCFDETGEMVGLSGFRNSDATGSLWQKVCHSLYDKYCISLYFCLVWEGNPWSLPS